MKPTDKIIVSALNKLLYLFLPVARTASKGPVIARTLRWTSIHNPERLPILVEAIVKQSIACQEDGFDPLTREDITELARLLNQLGVPVLALADPGFLQTLPAKSALNARSSTEYDPLSVTDRVLQKLKRQHAVLGALSPHARGYAFEKFLSDLFETFNLASRRTFRVLGDQIEGIFELDQRRYLLAAKWQDSPLGSRDLVSFTDKVKSKGLWARGVLVSNSGFCLDELNSYGRSNPVVYIDGSDINAALFCRFRFDEVIREKVFQAKQTGRSFVRVRDLIVLRKRAGSGIAA